MKKVLFILLAAVFMISMSVVSYAAEGEETTTNGVGATDVTEPTTGQQEPSTEPQEPSQPDAPEEIIEDVVSLDGKTIMIVGNSMVYYGNCVILGDQGKEDHGYFYQLIASNGENATVIDHTYPGKKLDYIYENYLVNIDPKEFEKVDYLVLSEGNQYNENLVATCERIIALCPNIEGFRFLRQPNMFDIDDENLYLPVLIEGVEKLKAAGYEVVDWGKLVRDIFTGEVEVPGATLDFKRTTFMKENLGYKNAKGTAVSQGISGDRNHQNPLSGYVTAQMLYTSLTNRSAVFSDYSFCDDKNISIYFDLPEFERVHYTGTEKTNFRQIFASAQDMLGLQKLIDIYVAKEGRHPLTVQKGIDVTCTSNGLTQGSFCSLCGKVVKTQQVIESLGEHELVFLEGKEETCTVDGLTDGISCSKCNEIIKPQQVIPARVHSGLTSTTAATTSKDGEVKSICKYCGELLSTEVVKSVKSITISQSKYVHSGAECKPTVTVLDKDGKLLKEGTDYTVGYESGRILPGKYTVKVTLKGKYTGVHRRYFTVSPKAVTGVTAESTSSEIKLTWKAAEGATTYRIYELNTKSGEYEYLKSVTDGTTCTVSELKAGTVHNFKIRGYVKDEEVILSPHSDECEIATVPSAVTGISATQTTSSIKLSWEAVKGASGYRVNMFNAKKNAYEEVSVITKGTEFELKTLPSATVHKFTVTPFISTKSGEISGASVEFTTSTKPGVTSKITATQTASSITLTWNKVKGATAYRVYKYSTKTKSYESVAYVKGTSYEVKKLSSGTVYKFKIRAYTDIDCGKFIGAQSTELRTATKPAVTSKITATQTASSITLTWAEVKGATAYRVYKYSTKTKSYESVAYVKGTSYEVKKLSSGTVYKFKIRAYTDIDCGKFIGAQSTELRTATKPAVTSKITATQTASSIKLTWSAVKGATAYRVYQYNPKTKAYESVAYVTDGTSYEIKKLSSGTVYKFKVRAYMDISCGKFIGANSGVFETATKKA